MFDVGFWEVSLILVVMLIVIGPERLPGVVRKAGLWIGKARRMVAEVKVEVDRELQLEELKQSINQQAHLDELKQLARDVRSVDADIRKESRGIESDVRSSWEANLDAKDEPEDKFRHPPLPEHSGGNDSSKDNLTCRISVEDTAEKPGNITSSESPRASKPPPGHSESPTS